MELAGLEPATSGGVIQAPAEQFEPQKWPICGSFAYRFEAAAPGR